MYKIDEAFLNDLLRDHSRAMVGRLCKQIEILQESKDIVEDKKLSLLKNFNRELVYESFRDLKNQIKANAMGLNYKKFQIKSPSTHKK